MYHSGTDSVTETKQCDTYVAHSMNNSVLDSVTESRDQLSSLEEGLDGFA